MVGETHGVYQIDAYYDATGDEEFQFLHSVTFNSPSSLVQMNEAYKKAVDAINQRITDVFLTPYNRTHLQWLTHELARLTIKDNQLIYIPADVLSGEE